MGLIGVWWALWSGYAFACIIAKIYNHPYEAICKTTFPAPETQIAVTSYYSDT